MRNVIEWIAIIAAALVVALVIKTFLFQAFYIPSDSMQPTLKPQDRVLVNKLSYKLHAVHRGDIVVFKRPPSEAGDPTIKDLIKRVIGLPGDTIEERGGQVYINGQELKEPYLPAGTVTNTLPPTKVAPGQYFVMGDNRTNSEGQPLHRDDPTVVDHRAPSSGCGRCQRSASFRASTIRSTWSL